MKQLAVIHTLMAVAAMQGAAWGSISCPRTLWHADQGNQISDPPITRRWLYPLSHSTEWQYWCCGVGWDFFACQSRRAASYTLLFELFAVIHQTISESVFGYAFVQMNITLYDSIIIIFPLLYESYSKKRDIDVFGSVISFIFHPLCWK